MQISAAIITLVAAATTTLNTVNAAAVTTAEDGILRAPIMRNPNLGNPLEVAKMKYRMLNRRAEDYLDKRDQQYKAPLYNDQGSQYLIQVGVGTPPQNFAVTLDTGSADLWVPSTECPASNCPFYRFDSSKSSTFKTLNKPFGIQYGIGSVNGSYATDTVTVGGASIPNQQFGLASMTEDILQPNPSAGGAGSNAPEPFNTTSKANVEANGILGLGYPSLTQANSQGEGPYNPFVFNLAAQKVINEPVFSIFLNSIKEDNWSGEIIFGGIDSTKFDGDLVYLPVAALQTKASGFFGSSEKEYYYWMVYGQGLGVTNSPVENPSWKLRELGAFILDTGTTLTYFPTSVATDIVKAIAGDKYTLDRSSGVFIVDCAVGKSPARFELQMSQTNKASNSPVTLSVPASELVIPIDGTSIDNANLCMFGIAPLGGSGSIGSNMYLVGDSVLRSAYMVYDMGNNRVGLAANKGIGGKVTAGSSVSNGSNNNGSGASNAAVANSVGSLSSAYSLQSSIGFTGAALLFTAISMSML
ncbi:aspartic peptidase domain-containing protein [Mycotypha africana]|uniref:aspartic peptidase domain-containing protein n=1 Tax=Mycotypha africana TaxID=64632 RepID=UPI00230065B8|nr:aspartic peptidase domain-containing protein [Mycotypha africana]KAI8967350.1 aspartic peptidase domain-containing protein [Mycotypha africana]